MDYVVTPHEGLMSEEIQKVIDECYRNGGGRIVLEKGLYLMGGIRLRSHCTLYLKSGAVLKGTRDPEDYKILRKDTVEPVEEEYLTDAVWVSAKRRTTHDHILKAASDWNNAIIRIFKAEDVAVIGEEGSVIDGSDCYDAIGEEHYRGPHGISAHYSKNLRFEGYTIRNTGNWAHLGFTCQNLSYRNLIVEGGHDGVHVSVCDDIFVTDCRFFTGDDCVAGFDNYNVEVLRCEINSACSGMRFGGTNVLVEDCHFYGPAKYFFRGSLSLEDKIAGNPAPTEGRKNMLALFTYYSDFSLTVRHVPENIVLRNCKVENVGRFLHYDFTGNQIWQKNKPLREITFEGIEAKGVEMPLNAYGDPSDPLTLRLVNSSIAFEDGCSCAIKAGHFALIEAKDLKVENLAGPLVTVFGQAGELRCENLVGVEQDVNFSDEEFFAKAI